MTPLTVGHLHLLICSIYLYSEKTPMSLSEYLQHSKPNISYHMSTRWSVFSIKTVLSSNQALFCLSITLKSTPMWRICGPNMWPDITEKLSILLSLHHSKLYANLSDNEHVILGWRQYTGYKIQITAENINLSYIWCSQEEDVNLKYMYRILNFVTFLPLSLFYLSITVKSIPIFQMNIQYQKLLCNT